MGTHQTEMSLGTIRGQLSLDIVRKLGSRRVTAGAANCVPPYNTLSRIKATYKDWVIRSRSNKSQNALTRYKDLANAEAG